MPSEATPLRRPIHQWKSFWLGILIVEFICWAWHHSLDHRTLLESRIASHTLLIERHTGVTHLVPGWPVRHTGISFQHYPSSTASDVPAICAERHLTCLQLRDPTVILSFLTLWSAYLIVRSQRPRRLTAPDPAA